MKFAWNVSQAYILKHGTIWNELKPPGTSWNHMEQSGTTWNNLEQGETTFNEMDSATNWHKKQEVHKKKLCTEHHWLIKYKVGNSYCHKQHHLRCLQVESPRTEWTQWWADTNKGTHSAILCVQYHQPTRYNFTNTYRHKELHLKYKQDVPDLALLYVYFK